VKLGPQLMLAASLGCALSIPPASLEPHLAGGVPPGVDAARPRLGVGRFVDARPPLDRAGAHPGIELRWFGLARQGENRTGDAAFEGDVALAAQRDAAATLARSGAFSGVELVDVGDARAARGELPDGLDLLLTATLDELVGTQYQDAVLSIAVIGLLRNRFEPPQGRAALRFRLYDRRGLRFEAPVDAVHRSQRRTISQAALDALARANEQLADRLHAKLVPELERRRYRLPVLVLDACGAGDSRTERLLGQASAVFEREIGTELSIRRRSWRAPARRELETAFARVRRVPPPFGGIVVAFVPLADAREWYGSESRTGLAATLGRHALVGCTARGLIRPHTVVHEIAHLFGAVHVFDRSSVMYPVLEFDGRFFDPWNREILRATAGRHFDEPLPGAVAKRLSAIYRAAAARPNVVDAGDLETARGAVESHEAARVGAPR
jgi:hypothetical protein